MDASFWIDASFTIDEAKREMRCKIVDVSEGGAGLSYNSIGGSVPIGAVGRLIVPGIGESRAQIRWASLGTIGVSFMSSTSTLDPFNKAILRHISDMRSRTFSPDDATKSAPSKTDEDLVAASPAGQARRRNERFNISLPATMWLASNDMRLNCKVADISEGGAGLTYDTIVGVLPVNGEGILTVPTLGEVRAEIRWLSFGQMGVAFKGDPSHRAPFTKAVRQLIAELVSSRLTKLRTAKNEINST